MKTRKKTSRGKNTKENIINIASQLFIDQGYHATATRQITDELGIAPSAIYNHFKNKEEIFKAVLYKYHPWNKIPIAIERSSGDEIEDLITNSARILLDLWGEKPELSRLHLIEMLEFKGSHLPKIYEMISAKSTEIYDEIAKENQAVQENQKFLFTRALIGLFFGYIMTDKNSMTNESDDISGGLDYFADAYLQGIFIKEEIDKEKNS